MSTSQTPDQATETTFKEKAELEARVKYLQTQLGQLLEERRRMLRGSRSPMEEPLRREAREEESFLSDSSDEDGEEGRASRLRGDGNLDFKVDIPSFEGQLDPDLFLDWLRTVERVFDFKDVPEEKKVKLVALKLRKCAAIWWANLVAKRARRGKAKIRTWEKMKSKLKDRFLPPSYLPLYSTYDEVCVLAHKVEYQKKAKPPQRDFPKPTPMSEPFNKGNSFPPPKPTVPNPSTPQKNLAPQSRPNPGPLNTRRCFTCQGLGHFASDCPNQKIVTLAEYQASFEELEEEGRREEKELLLNEPMEEVEEGPDEGELLVIREFDHKEITLTPLKTPTPSKPEDQPLLSVFLTTLLKSQMHEYEPYKEWILLNQEPPQPTASRHPLLTPLLQDFQHVFPQVIPRELPHVQDGFLSKGSQLYITKCGFRELFIREVHGGALTGPFGEQKMTSMLKEHYYRPTLSRDVEYYIKRFKRKSKVQSILDENEDIPSLRTSSHQPGEYDGDHPPIVYTIMEEDGGDSKEC